MPVKKKLEVQKSSFSNCKHSIHLQHISFHFIYHLLLFVLVFIRYSWMIKPSNISIKRWWWWWMIMMTTNKIEKKTLTFILKPNDWKWIQQSRFYWLGRTLKFGTIFVWKKRCTHLVEAFIAAKFYSQILYTFRILSFPWDLFTWLYAYLCAAEREIVGFRWDIHCSR